MAAAEPREAVGLVIAATLAILDVQVSGAVWRIPTAVFQGITLSHGLTTCGAIGSELTVLTALTLPTVCTISQHTGCGIAAGVSTLLYMHEQHG